PDNIRLVSESPRLHDPQPLGEEGVRAPQVEMRFGEGQFRHGQRRDLLEAHGVVTAEPPVFRRHFAGAVREPPGGVNEESTKFPLDIVKRLRVLGHVLPSPRQPAHRPHQTISTASTASYHATTWSITRFRSSSVSSTQSAFSRWTSF